MESFDRFQLAGLTLICLKNERKADAERDWRDLVSAAGADRGREGASRKATAPPGIGGQSAPAGLGKVQPGASWCVFFRDGHQTMTLPFADLNAPHLDKVTGIRL
jgi:hypothetical protein